MRAACSTKAPTDHICAIRICQGAASVLGLPVEAAVCKKLPMIPALVVCVFAVVALLHPREFLTRTPLAAVEPGPVRYSKPLVFKSVLVTAAMVVLFFLGQPIAKVAILGGSILLVTRRIKAEKVYFDIDWPLLVMFIGLFVVVAGLEKAVIGPDVIAAVGRLNLESVPMLATLTAILGNLVSNVPAVLVLKPFVTSLGDPQSAWLVVAMASTLAGNLTIVGSVANLIVVQRARSHHIDIGFWTHFRVGAPVTVLTILFGIWWLS